MSRRSPSTAYRRVAALSFAVLSGCGPELGAAGDDAPQATTSIVTSPILEAAVDGQQACSPSDIGEYDGRIVAIETVEDGLRGPRCFGVDAEPLDAAWDLLRLLADDAALGTITRLVAFEPDDDTIAFAGPVDPNDNAAGFYVAVDFGADPDDAEFIVTVVHELAHVLTAGPDELDLDDTRFTCDTWFTGYGCTVPGGVLDGFVARFWDEASLDALPPDGRPDLGAGDTRCSLDPAFLGAYAASHPEEDLAESFAAYVLGSAVAPEAEPRLAYFEEFPRLAAMRDRAEAAGLAVDLDAGCG